MPIICDKLKIGNNIRKFRKERGWSQEEVARRLNISNGAFSKIESGITDVNTQRLNQIASVLGFSVLEILASENTNFSPENLEVKILKEKLASNGDEIIKLQKKIIDLYEEMKNYEVI